MATFSLLIWLAIAGQTEVMRVDGLTEDQCFRREMAIAIRMDPKVIKTQCVPGHVSDGAVPIRPPVLRYYY